MLSFQRRQRNINSAGKIVRNEMIIVAQLWNTLQNYTAGNKRLNGDDFKSR